jgi:hypothetical protein
LFKVGKHTQTLKNGWNRSLPSTQVFIDIHIVAKCDAVSLIWLSFPTLRSIGLIAAALVAIGISESMSLLTGFTLCLRESR